VKRAKKQGLTLARAGRVDSLEVYELALKAPKTPPKNLRDCDITQISSALEALCNPGRVDAWETARQKAWDEMRRLHGLTLSEVHELLAVEEMLDELQRAGLTASVLRDEYDIDEGFLDEFEAACR
jgi:hypothetical protein